MKKSPNKKIVRRAPPTRAGVGLMSHIDSAQKQAFREGFTITGRALNRALKVLGWEQGGDEENAARIERGEKPK